MPEWCTEYCHCDRYKKSAESLEDFYALRMFHSARKSSSSADDAAFMGKSMLWEYVYVTQGRPKYFLPSHLAELLLKSNISGDLAAKDLRMPYDVFTVVFEKGFEVYPGIPLRTLRLARLKSALARKAILTFFEKCGDTGPDAEQYVDNMLRSNHITTTCDVGRMEDGTFSHESEEAKVVWHHMPPEMTLNSYATDEQPPQLPGISDRNFGDRLARVIMAILLRNHCRPETLVPLTLPRSCRYHHKGERDAFRLFTYPWVKQLRAAPEGEAALDELGGRTKVKAHVRGFVYRTLRDERYRRNADGSFRVIEVEPCIIHPEEFEGVNNVGP